MNRTFSWSLVAVFAVAGSQLISAQTAGIYPNVGNASTARPAGQSNSNLVNGAAGPAGIIAIGSSLTFGGTNAPDTYSAATTFSSTPVVVDNGAVRIWQEQVATGPNGEWDIFHVQTTNGGPLANNLGGLWNILMTYTLSAPAFFDGVVNQWAVNGVPVSPLSDFGTVCCASSSNPILPGEAYYKTGFSSPFPAGPFANWQQAFSSPYSFVSSGGINPSTANQFTFALHFTLQSASVNYYFSHFVFAENWESTLTYNNYSPQSVTCTTNFYDSNGAPLPVPFAQGTVTTRTDVLAPGGSIHDPTTAPHTGTVVPGWAQATCTGPVQASMLFREYANGVPLDEAGVNAETAPTTEFATFAETNTGVAYANPSTTQSATITFTVYNNAGTLLGSHSITLGPLQHSASNIGPLLGLASFTGFVKITSTIPIVSLSLNFESAPIFSSLPPGDLASSTLLVTP